ncbi:MAG: cytochrome c biogenesis protein CcdA [Actinomycetota bacterium]
MTIVLAQAGGVEGAIAGPAGILVAFVVGMVSFFSPCILPVLPGYLSYVSGVSGEELESGARRGRVVLGTTLFVLGFAAVFSLLGYATASAVDSLGFLLDHFSVVNRIAGVFVILMGLAFLSTLSVRTFQRWREQGGTRAGVARVGLGFARVVGMERRLDAKPMAGVAGAFPLGAAFAIGWTPCVGPGLSTIFVIAGTQGSGLRGGVLLFSFSLGLGIWFILGGLAFRRGTRAVAWLRRHMRTLVAIGGTFLLTIGILLVTDYWNTLLSPFRRWLVNFTPPI